MRHRLTAAAAAFSIAFVPLLAASQDAYPDPSETIDLIIPNSAGGGTDIAARLLAEGLEEKLGPPVVVHNLSGAGGIEAVTRIMSADPDGYTLGLVPVPMVSMYYLDPERGGDFEREKVEVVAQHDYGPLAIAVAADSPYQTLDDVVQAAKADPGSITSASSSVLGAGHLSLLRLNKVAGVDLNWTAMEQQGTALASLLGGHIDIITDTFSELYPHAQSGDLRILAAFDEERPAQMPDVPTAQEQGYDVVLTTTRMLIAPDGTPEEIIATVESAVEELIADPEYQEKATQRQVGISFRNAEDAAGVWQNIDENFGPIVAEFRKQ
jgi:tripartite-type tricarboxylate transporter receptor subunit TctC